MPSVQELEAELARRTARIAALEAAAKLPGATVASLRKLAPAAVADLMATPDGRARIERALSGGRDLAGLDLADPKVLAGLSMDEVAANFTAIEAAQAAKETTR